MILMFLLLALIAFIVFHISNRIKEITNIPEYILYLIIGIIFGISGIHNLFGDIFNLFGTEVMSEVMAEYNELISLVVLMLGSSLALNFDQIKKSGKIVTFMAIVPLYIESIVMGIILYLLLQIIPLGFEVNIFETVLIGILVGPTQPAVIMPFIMKLLKKEEKTKNNIDSTFLLSSIVENFTGIPFIFILLSILISLSQSTGNISIPSVVMTSVIVIIVIIISSIIVFLIGKLYIKLTNMTLVEKISNDNQYIAYSLLTIFTAVLVVYISGPLTMLSILFGLMFGLGMNATLSTEHKVKIQHYIEHMFTLFCAPIIFLSVGGGIILSEIFSVNVILIGTIFYFVSVIVKSIIAKEYLRRHDFEEAEIKYVTTSFLAKGVGAINVIGVLTAMLVGTGYSTDTLLMYIAIIEILISFPLYTYKIKKVQENLF